METKTQITEISVKAKAAARALRAVNSRRKGAILRAMSDALDESRDEILAANQKDVAAAENRNTGRESLDAISLDGRRLSELVREIGTIADLNDPVGSEDRHWIRPNGIEIVRRKVPIGVIAVAFEERISMVARAMAMCIKTANALVLHGSCLCQKSATMLFSCLLEAAEKKGLPKETLNLLPSHSVNALKTLVGLEGVVDLVIPCGGPELEAEVLKHARVPVVRQSWSGSHIYVDVSARLQVAVDIIENTVCGATRGFAGGGGTLLVHQAVADECLALVAKRLEGSGVRLLGHGAARHALNDLREASDADWRSAGAGGSLCIRVVNSVEEAVSHIVCYGTGHSECIVAEDDATAKLFVCSVDAPCVYVNASAALTSGAEFGMGSELAVSVDKLHARGPIGLEELTTYHYVIQGSGQVAE